MKSVQKSAQSADARRVTIKLAAGPLAAAMRDSAHVTQSLERYFWMVRQADLSKLLTDDEWTMAHASLAAWRTDVAEFIYVTAPATARSSGVASEDFVRKLGALEGPELFLLAEEIDRERQGRAKF